MAWDLTHVRLVEREYMTLVDNDLRFAIHILLTFDNGLKDILKINPIEQIALCDGLIISKLTNSLLDYIEGATQMLMSQEKIKRRKSMSETWDIESLCVKLENALLRLCDIS